MNSKANDEYEELFSNLFNINKWNAIPLFINAIVNPSLPAKTQTRLYEFLSILSIFSADFERAGEFSKKIEMLSKKNGDKKSLNRARLLSYE